MRILIGPIYRPWTLGQYSQDPRLIPFVDVGLSHAYPVINHPATLYFDSRTEGLHDLLKQIEPPDIVVWWHHFSRIPEDISTSPCPTLLIISDSQGVISQFCDYAQVFDWILTDRIGVKALQQFGHYHSSYWPCYAWNPLHVYPLPDTTRDWDICFMGNLYSVAHYHRNPLLEILARLGQQYRVFIGHAWGDAYNHILNRSKIAFNHAIRGEMNDRAYEIAVAGALQFIEADNLEIFDVLPAGIASVAYTAENLESQLHHYLQNETARLSLTQAAQTRIQAHSYSAHMDTLFKICEQRLNTPTKKDKSIFLSRSPVERALTALRPQLYRESDLNRIGQRLISFLPPPGTLPAIPNPEYRRLYLALLTLALNAEQHHISLPGFPSTASLWAVLNPQWPEYPVALVMATWTAHLHQQWQTLLQMGLQAVSWLNGQPPSENLWPATEYLVPLGDNHLIALRQIIFLNYPRPEIPQQLCRLLLWHVRLLMGQAAFACQDLPQAESHYQAAIAGYPYLAEPLISLGYIQALQAKIQPAQASFEQGLALNIFNVAGWRTYLQFLHYLDTPEPLKQALDKLAIYAQAVPMLKEVYAEFKTP